MQTIEDALNRMEMDANKQTLPLSIFPITLYLWLDTNQKTCAPITGTLRFQVNARNFIICDLIRAINKVTPIYAMKIRRTTYHIMKTEEFMNKRCEV